MNSLDYELVVDEQKILDNNVNDLLSDVQQGMKSREELVEIAKLLEVNHNNFERFKAEAWFKKAWLCFSGRRGQLTDISITSLGKVQVGVLKVMGEVLNDTSGVKEDILFLFSQISKIETQSIEFKYLLLKFNEKHRAKFKELWAEVREVRNSLRITQALVGISFITGAIFIFIPILFEKYWIVGLSSWCITGTLLVGLSILGYRKRQREKTPIPIENAGTVRISEAQKKQKLALTECYLGIKNLSTSSTEESADNRVFKIENKISGLLDYFQLTNEEQRLLFSLECCLTSADVENTVERAVKRKKKKWLKEWKKLIDRQLSSPIVDDVDELFRGLSEVKEENLTIPKLGTLLLETAIFIPYYQLNSEEKNEKLDCDQDKLEEQVKVICRELGFGYHLLSESKRVYSTALKEIPPSNLWSKVVGVLAAAILIAITGGVAAPIIGGAIGAAMGLSGAAAVSAGLALLGGGAIAAGGLGMAGGTAVLIGGGAILGGGIGSGMLLLFSSSKHLVLRELAKLESASKILLVTLPDARQSIQSVIKKERDTQKRMREEISSIHSKKNVSKKEIKELEAGVDYCENAIKRLEVFIEERSVC